MPKRIKRQIKKSIPFFVIISLIMSSTAMGLFFNIDYNIYNFFNESEFPVVSLPEVQATDIASTTVEVQNAPPSMTGHPAEVPASTSTSPINIGNTLTITVEATDGESDSYYLIICSSDGIEASSTDHTSHACTDTTFGSSTLTATGVVATTTFTVSDPGAETDEWYAFVCDDHATQADCSDSSQGSSPGSGDDSSPFYINHAPMLDIISTGASADPGGTFTVTASSTDSDVLGGFDILHLYVCGSIGWDVITGCTNELCSGTSTTPNISCDFATGTPAVDGDYEYYAYVIDQHDFAATGNYATSTYTVNNVAPVVGSVTLNGGVDIVLNMMGMDAYIATTSAPISDNNGCTDIENGGYATSTIYWSNATGEHNCAADNDYCYPIASTYCTILSGSCTGSSDAALTYTCSTTIAYHATPTDESDGNTASTTYWLAGITVFDDDGAYGTATSVAPGVDVMTLEALDITEEIIPYLTIKGGDNSGNYNATTTVVNYGNCPIDTGVDVNNMDKDEDTGTIEAENQEFAINPFTYGSGTWSVEEASSTLQVDIDAVKPTTGDPDISAEIYWGIAIPVGKPSGTYTGSSTFTVILDDDNW